MKLSLKHIILLTVLVIFVLGTIVPFFVDKPRDKNETSFREFSIVMTGFPPGVDKLFSYSIILVGISAGLSMFRVIKLDKSIVNEGGIFRLRFYCNFYYYLVLTGTLLCVVQIAFAIFGLLKNPHIHIENIFHSNLVDGLGGFFLFVLLFTLPYKYIKTIRIVPSAVLLVAKQKANSEEQP